MEQNKCNKCGRPMQYAAEPKCNYCDACMNEYCGCKLGRIKEIEPTCDSTAVIPSITVDTVDGITNLANCLVHVTSNNTTYYVDDKHRIMITWAGPVDIPGYDMEGNPNKYKDQIVTDTEAQMAVIYDKHGKGYIFGITSSDLQSAVDNKLDEMAEDGTLEEIVGDYIDNKVTYIFPKNIPNGYMGDCNIIKTTSKNILIDCDIVSNWSHIKDYLDNNGCEHLDYFILSHYHSDHMGNLENLVNNGYIDSNTTVFLPLVPSQFPDIVSVETATKAMLTQSGIQFSTPANNSVLEIDNINIKFGNLDLAYMEANYTNYNWCSMVCLITHGNTCALYLGDGGIKTCEYLYKTDFVTRTVDLYKQGHHGIDYNSYTLFYEIIAPRHVVQSSGIMDYQKNNFLSPETSYLIKNGSLYYPTFMQQDFIKFQSNTYDVQCLNGKNFSTSGNIVLQDIYVDANASASAPQDGTQEHPFKELMQAITSIQNYPNSRISIYLADGTYGLGHEAPGTSEKNTIKIYLNPSIDLRIYGNSSDRSAVVISNVRCFGSYVKMYNLTVNKDNSSLSDKTGIYLYNSTAYLDNVHVTSLTGDKANYGIVATEGTRLYMNNCKVEYAATAIRNMRSSVFTFDDLVVDNCTNYINNSDGYVCPKNIMDQSGDFVVTLKEDFTKFNCLNIQYRDGDGNRHSLRITSPTVGHHFPVSVPYINSSGVVYEERAMLTLTSNNTIELSNKYEISYYNGSAITITQQESGGIHIQQVWGELDYS